MPARTSPGSAVGQRTLSSQFDVHGFKPTYESSYGSARVTPGGYVHNVAVRESERGKGYGSALMAEITTDADRLQRPVSLHAREELHPWYRRMGFEVQTGPKADLDRSIFGQPYLVRKPRR
jgi:GNAT superfamily N-acetyltransferase